MKKHTYGNTYKAEILKDKSLKTGTSNRKVFKFLCIGLSMALSGCMGVYEGGFECPAGVGVGCKSISEVNHMINHGEIPQTLQSESSERTCKDCNNPQPQDMKPQIWYAPSALGGEA